MNFAGLISYVWGLLDTEINFSSIGVDQSVSLLQIMVGSTAFYMLAKFVNFCMGERID